MIDWHCPNCNVPHVRGPSDLQGVMLHACPGKGGVSCPMIPLGTRAEIVLLAREDYEGTERGLMHHEDGRSIMAVKTVRDEGEDVVIFPGLATVTTKGAL